MALRFLTREVTPWFAEVLISATAYFKRMLLNQGTKMGYDRPNWASLLGLPLFSTCEKTHREFCYDFRKGVLKIVNDVLTVGATPLELAYWLDLEQCMNLIAEDAQRCAQTPLLDELLSPLTQDHHIDVFIEAVFASGLHDTLAWWGLQLPDLAIVARCDIAKTLAFCVTRADGKPYAESLRGKLKNVALFFTDHLKLTSASLAEVTPKTPLDKTPLLCYTGCLAVSGHDPESVPMTKCQNVITLAMQSLMAPPEAFPDEAAQNLHMIVAARLNLRMVVTPVEYAYSLCLPGAMDTLKPVLDWLYQVGRWLSASTAGWSWRWSIAPPASCVCTIRLRSLLFGCAARAASQLLRAAHGFAE